MIAAELFADRLTVLIVALLLNALLAGPRRFLLRIGWFRPGQALAALLRTLERKLNRERRTSEERRARGWILALLMLAAGMLAAVALMIFCAQFPRWGVGLEALILASVFSLRQTSDFSLYLAEELPGAELPKARGMLAGTPWRNAALLDAHGVARAGVESAAVHFAEKTVSPAAWYLLLGLPGAFAARMAALLAETLAHTPDGFGRGADRLAFSLHFLPSALASLLLALAAFFVPFAKPMPALAAWIANAFTAAPRCTVLSVTGAALGLSLGGPLSVYVAGVYAQKSRWLGGQAARAAPRDVRYVATLTWIAGLLLLLLCGFFRLA